MSFNRLKYDTCSLVQENKTNVSTLGYLLSPLPFEHGNKCRHEFGLVGGTAVSHIQGNLVDMESDLRGQTRAASRCAAARFQPAKNFEPEQPTQHLGACQMIPYKKIPAPPAMKISRCTSK